MNRRKYRYENGSLFIENFKKRFILDKDNNPIDFVIEERMDSNFMVEEFMLLANKLIGKFMVGSCKELSLLRKHEFPKEVKLSRFKDFCK